MKHRLLRRLKLMASRAWHWHQGRTLVRVLVGIAVFGSILSLTGRGIAAKWGELGAEQIRFDPVLLLLSVFIGGLAICVVALAWARLVRQLAGPAKARVVQLLLAFTYSWLGRNVPGRIGQIAGQLYLGRSLGIPLPTLAGTTAFHNVLLLVVALALVSLTLIPSLAHGSGFSPVYLSIPALALGGLFVLHPSILRRAARLALRFRRREANDISWVLPFRTVVILICLYAASYLLFGVAFYLIILSLTPFPIVHIPLAVGAYTLAMVIGRMVFFL